MSRMKQLRVVLEFTQPNSRERIHVDAPPCRSTRKEEKSIVYTGRAVRNIIHF